MAGFTKRSEVVQVIDILGLTVAEANQIAHALRKHAAVVGHELNLPVNAQEYITLATLFSRAAQQGRV